MESGIEMHTIRVLRQLPRKSKIMRPVRMAAILASFKTPLIDARTNSDWSKSCRTLTAGGIPARILGNAAFT